MTLYGLLVAWTGTSALTLDRDTNENGGENE